MIVRIFKVRIHKGCREDFEKDFGLISLPLVKAQKGLVSLSFGKVIDQDKDEYVLITTWENQDALVAFCGEAWGQAVIPHGMEKYIEECWVYHFEQFHNA
jgi:heme-degrading monooxygenase HmoA